MADLFDTDPSNRVPQDSEALWMGASRIRGLKGTLQTMLGKIFDNSYNFLPNAIPGSALVAQSVKSGQLLDNTVGGASQSDLIQAKHLANGIITLDQIDTTDSNKLFGDGLVPASVGSKTIVTNVDGKTMKLAVPLGQTLKALMVNTAGIGDNEVSQGIARIWIGGFTGAQGGTTNNGLTFHFVEMQRTQYGRGGSGQVDDLQPDLIVVTRAGFADTFMAWRAEATTDGNGNQISPMHALYNGGGTAIAGNNLNSVFWGVGGVGFLNTNATYFNGWTGGTGWSHYMLALGF